MTLSKQLFHWLVGCCVCVCVCCFSFTSTHYYWCCRSFRCLILFYALNIWGCARAAIVSLVGEYQVVWIMLIIIVQYVTFQSSLAWCFPSFFDLYLFGFFFSIYFVVSSMAPFHRYLSGFFFALAIYLPLPLCIHCIFTCKFINWYIGITIDNIIKYRISLCIFKLISFHFISFRMETFAWVTIIANLRREKTQL